MPERLLGELTKNWWAFVLQGVLAILFAIGAFFWPGLTLAVLIVFFGAWAFVDGIFSIIAAFKAERAWPFVLRGVLGIGVGLVTFFYPALTGFTLLIIIAVWSIIKGVLEISAAIRLREEMEGEWLLILAGAVSIVFGGLIILRPGAGALAVSWIIGFYAAFFGILMIVLGFKLKGVRNKVADVREAVEDKVEAAGSFVRGEDK